MIRQSSHSALSGQMSRCSGSKCVLTGTSRVSYGSSVLIPGDRRKVKSLKAPEQLTRLTPGTRSSGALLLLQGHLLHTRRAFHLDLTLIPPRRLPVRHNIFNKAAKRVNMKNKQRRQTKNQHVSAARHVHPLSFSVVFGSSLTFSLSEENVHQFQSLFSHSHK